MKQAAIILVALAVGLVSRCDGAESWPQWRGSNGGVSSAIGIPVRWSDSESIRWRTDIPGEGSSSPIIWQDRAFVTSSLKRGEERLVHALDFASGKTVWTRTIVDENPEITSAVTGYAAATPATDGKHVVAFFGNAGVVCFSLEGQLLWRRRFGEFESELGLASSPIIVGDRVYLLCDHDGNRTSSFDSFLVALSTATGEIIWTSKRTGLQRSWSTPLIVPALDGQQELVVSAQHELRGYDPVTGKRLWLVTGLTDWVSPTPVFGQGLIFATCGKDGPTLAVRPGGQGDVTKTHEAWREKHGGPYVCSPLLYDSRLYVHNEAGVLTCFEARTGELLYRERLGGKFTASGVAADGHVYLINEAGECHVIRAGAGFERVAINRLGEVCLASPGIASGHLLLRTEKRLYCVGM